MTLSLPIEHEANELLSRDGFALLLAMMLDQQVPFEKAFNSPYQLVLRLGHEPTAQEIADFNPEALSEVFAERPALHRFPRAMTATAVPYGLPRRTRPSCGAGWLSCPGSAPIRPRSRSRCSVSSSASSPLAGARKPVTSARLARITRSPTSTTTPRSQRSGPTRKRSSSGQRPLPPANSETPPQRRAGRPGNVGAHVRP
jgi:hypothetical protein